MCILLCLLLAIEPLATLQLEIVEKEDEKQWGLMGREHLPDDYGMLFVYKPPTKVNFWMFNVFVDLSVAYLDGNGVIMELHDLKAHPEMMDPKRPVKSISDMKKYGYFERSIAFFKKHSISSKEPVSYVLEVNQGFFEKNEVKVGDYLLFDPNSVHAKIYSNGKHHTHR